MNDTNCSDVTTTESITPQSVTLTHSATGLSNQQKFVYTASTIYPAGCAVPAFGIAPNQTDWVSSDPINAPVSTVHDATNGTVTCLGATLGAVTITPNPGKTKVTASITCQ